VVPWLLVYRITFERPLTRSRSSVRLSEGLGVLARHPAYRTLCAIYIPSRIAIDMVAAMFIYYVTWVLGRGQDFELAMGLLFTVVILSLPGWLGLAKRLEKRTVFVIGMLWWVTAQGVIALGSPEWPRWALFAMAAFAGVGYGVADFMPWAMLPDVIDEDELATGERREGLYTGTFTFLRKIGGATAVLLIGVSLDLVGYDGTAEEQPERALHAIRVLMAGVPTLFLVWSIWASRRYPLSRDAHHAIRRQLESRREPPRTGP